MSFCYVLLRKTFELNESVLSFIYGDKLIVMMMRCDIL